MVRKPHPVDLRLPRTTNQKTLFSSERLEGKWFYDICVKSVEDNKVKTFVSQKVEIPLWEGENEVTINLTDGESRSLSTLFFVKSDTILPELQIVFPKNYIEGNPILVTDAEFGIGVTCDDLMFAYINGQTARSEQLGDGQYFGKNLKLKKGTNHILIEVMDDAGNYVSKSVEVIRK